MMLKHGVATRLLYQVNLPQFVIVPTVCSLTYISYVQLYVALQRKVKSNLTGAAMQTMRASATVKLEQIESGLYKEVRY